MGVDKREKVIIGLECNLNFAEKSYCEQCGYECRKAMFISVPVNLLSDALSLLKAQEPRVMTPDEVKNAPKKSVVWLELKPDEIFKNEIYPFV